jgi:hypothetical protein
MQEEYIEVSHNHCCLWFTSGLQKYGCQFTMGKLMETVSKYKIICIFSQLTSGLSNRSNLYIWHSPYTWRLFESQPQIIQSMEERDKLLISFCCAWTHSAVNMPIGQQITNKTHPSHNRCWEWSLLLSTHYVQLCQKLTFTHWSTFPEIETIWYLKLWTPLFCVRHLISRGVFKPSTTFIQFFFTEHSALWFCSFLSHNDPVCIYLWLYD